MREKFRKRRQQGAVITNKDEKGTNNILLNEIAIRKKCFRRELQEGKLCRAHQEEED